MLSKILSYLANPTDVRSIAAFVAGALVTIFHPGNSAVITGVVDAFAGLIIALDTVFLHSRAAAKEAKPAPVIPITATTSSSGGTPAA